MHFVIDDFRSEYSSSQFSSECRPRPNDATKFENVPTFKTFKKFQTFQNIQNVLLSSTG